MTPHISAHTRTTAHAIGAKLTTLIVQGQRPEVSAEYLNRYPAYVDLMKECWAHEPQLRPTFPDIARRLDSLLQVPLVPCRPHIGM